jgi:DNA processing protein
MEEAVYWMWLADVLGMASIHAGSVLKSFPNARTLFEASRTADLSALLPGGAMRRLQQSEPGDYRAMLGRCLRSGIAVLTPDDPDYPARLRGLPDLPLVLYVTGSTASLNGGRYVGMVGTRRPTAYGVRACREISSALANSGVTVVSGLADGLDSEGHRAAVAAGVPTIGFLGTPIDVTYPASNAQLRRAIERDVGGAVVSEYPPDCQSDRKNTFLERNRLIAGMSEILCVAEARSQSGTANTVSHARRYGRPVYAVPGSIFSTVSEGTNALLAKGHAKMLRSANDVLAALEISGVEVPQQNEATEEELSPDARIVLTVLDAVPKDVAALCEACGLPAGTVLAALTELELYGLAAAAAGRRYIAAGGI